MTLDDFTRRIEGIGQELNNLDGAVLIAMSPIVNRIQSQAPVSPGGGALKQSIKMIAQSPTEFYLEMLAYGFFQNYGVKSVDGQGKNRNQLPVEPEARFGLPPRSGDTYQFGASNSTRAWGAYYSGLNAQGFFNMGLIAQELTERLQQEINNTIQ